MAANVVPIFPLTPKIGFATVATANTALDGTGSPATIFTAGSNGARVDQIIISHLGTNIDTVARIFINNGSTTATATNNALYAEFDMGANTLSQVAVSVQQFGSGLTLPAGYTLTATVGTTIAAGVKFLVIGGDY